MERFLVQAQAGPPNYNIENYMPELKFKSTVCIPLNNFGLNWGEAGIGFGQFHFHTDTETGTVYCDNECMSKDFIKKMLCQMVDDCELTDIKD